MSRAVDVCVRAQALLQTAQELLEACFVKANTPQPPGWCPVAAADLVEQAIAMLVPSQDDEDGD